MSNNKQRTLWAVFWALVLVFVFMASVIMIPKVNERVISGALIITFAVVATSLGIALIVLTVRQNLPKWRNIFFLMTGGSAIGMPVGIVLHNAVYALFIVLFGQDFWNGGDEPVFFIFGLIICPLAFLVGIISSLVLAYRR